MHRKLLLAVVVCAVAMCFAGTAWAQAPGAPGDAPPVRQEIGFLDGAIAIQLESDCRLCHEPVVNRHHMLTAGAQIPGGSVVPYPDADGDGVDDTFYGCTNCHAYIGTWPDGSLEVERDCVECHNQDSPHHTSDDAVERHCSECHGVVDDYDDGHAIPTYDPSLVTPARSLSDAGYYEDGSPEMENQGTGVLDKAEGTYAGTAGTGDTHASDANRLGLELASTGQDNDFEVDHASRYSSATFTVVVVHQPGIDPPTALWEPDATQAGKLTITFDSGVTTANAMVLAINQAEAADDGGTDDNHLVARLLHTQGEGTELFPDYHYSPEGGEPLNKNGFGAGGCNYCHDADGLDIILDNHDTHHGIGLPDDVVAGTPDDPYPGGTWRKCNLCHDYSNRSPHLDPARPLEATYHDAGGIGFQLGIRICEECHSVASLHNVQADSDGDGIVVGGELSGYGHVGRDAMVEYPAGSGTYVKDSDCWGCHGFAAPEGGFLMAAAVAPGAGPVIPSLYAADAKSITAGTDTTITLSGAGFSNTADGGTYVSDVQLTADDGFSVTLTPDAISEKSLAVTIPGVIPPGNYKVQAVKGDKASTPVCLTVVPDVSIASAVSDGPVTITGSGFGLYAASPETSVVSKVKSGRGRWVETAVVSATIVSWSDTEIVADFGQASVQGVTVNSVFGRASAEVEAAPKPGVGGDGGGRPAEIPGKGFGNGFRDDLRGLRNLKESRSRSFGF